MESIQDIVQEMDHYGDKSIAEALMTWNHGPAPK